MDYSKLISKMQAQGATQGSQVAGGAAGLGASLIPSTDKYGNVSRAGMTASSALQGATMGASLGPIGMAAGAVIGGAIGFAKSGKMKNEQEAQDRLLADVEKKNFMETSRSILASYPRSGVNVSGFYRNGGEINFNGSGLDRFNSKGGHLVPIAEGISIAKGNTHEQGGIDLYDGAQNFAEVEDDEVIYGTRVYSDTLKVPEYVLQAFKNSKKSKTK